MKEKLKIWILQIEGWVNDSNKFHRIRKNNFVVNISLAEAWNRQFPKFSSIIRTNIFWLVFPMILGALFLLFSDNSSIFENGVHWFNYAGLICFIWPVLYTLLGIVNWVYKGIKNWKGGKK